MFGYPCPFCNQRLLAAPERAGQRTICPKCLKPIVIPKPDDDPPPRLTANDTEADEVPITAMPSALEEEVEARPRPPARIGAAVGTADPIPLQPAAAVLFRNPDSVADIGEPTPGPVGRPEPYFPPPAAFATPGPLPEPPHFPHPAYPPAAGRITGDHPAATLPAASVGHSNTGGLVVFNPTDVDSADIAAELTQVLSLKMKPAPEPPSDLRPTTGLWITLTACGLALWAFCMLSDVEPLKYVALIGAAELLIGYAWVALAFGRRGAKQGLATLFPPLWVYRAANPPYEPGYRPLRFVVAGALLLTLYVIGPKVQPTLFAYAGLSDPTADAPPEIVETPLMKLEEAERERNPITVREQLTELAKPEALLSASASDKTRMVVALKRLAKHDRADVREVVLRAMVTWSPADAKPLAVAALTAAAEDERAAAYELISRWSDADVVKVLVDRLATAGSPARQALDEIGRNDRGKGMIRDALFVRLQAAGDYDDNLLYLANEYAGERELKAMERRAADQAAAGANNRLARCVAYIKERLGPRGTP